MSAKDDIPSIFLERVSPKGLEAIERCKVFVEQYALPADKIYHEQLNPDPALRWKSTPQIAETLKEKAREMGLWNVWLSKHYAEGAGYSNLEYGIMAGYLGRSVVAQIATNTNAPDTGNMELLAKYGTPSQKKRWLRPLLDGKIRSAFLMTEKGTSSSNALNIKVSATKNARGNWVLNGVKWFALGAGDPHCAVWMVMCKTADSKGIYENHSVLVLDAKRAQASGRATLVRPLTVFGYDDAPHGHFEVKFDNYEVPAEDMPDAMLASEGRGFELIQSRLGPGRIHHCMRLIGVGEQALIKVAHRAVNRQIFGTALAQRELFITAFAQHRIELQKCRMLVLDAAHKIDITNAKAARREIAMAKIETPRTVSRLLDWGIQMFGAEGVSQDTELARYWANNRTLQIADGPDEAHLNQLGRTEAKRFTKTNDFYAKQEEYRKALAKL